METNHELEDSKSSSEETDRSEQSNDETGTNRSYECVFCKRGFTTAQALGGHMNIHRKDRAKKSRPSSVPIGPGVDDKSYSSLRSSNSYQPIQRYQPHYVSYQDFFPVSSVWGFRPQLHAHHGEELFADNSRHMNPFSVNEDWHRSLNLRIGPSHVDDNESKKADGSSQEDELDLELRLGQYP